MDIILDVELIECVEIKTNMEPYDESRIARFLGMAIDVFPPVLHVATMTLFKIDAIKNEKGVCYARVLRRRGGETWIPISYLRPLVRCGNWMFQIHAGIPIDMKNNTTCISKGLSVDMLATNIIKMGAYFADIMGLESEGLGLNVVKINSSSARTELTNTNADYNVFKLSQSKITWI